MKAEEKTPNLATPFALDLKKDEGFLKTKPSEATKAELTAGIADSNSTTTNKLDKKTDGRHGETTGRQPPLLVGPVTLKYKEGFSISPSKGTSTPENAFKREARPLETNHGEMLENFSKAKEEATKRQDSEASFEEDLYVPSMPQSSNGWLT